MIKLNNPTQEEWFDFWAEELIQAGYITKLYKQEIKGWELLPKIEIKYVEHKVLHEGTTREKLKTLNKSYVLHQSVSYTPDRVIIWDKKALNVFFTELDSIQHFGKPKCYFIAQWSTDINAFITVLDVKSPFGKNNSSDVSFSIKKKLVWDKEHIYVNKSVNYPNKLLKNPEANYLWAATFTPERFYYTDRLAVNKAKPIPYRTQPNKKGVPLFKMRTLEEFLSTKA